MPQAGWSKLTSRCFKTSSELLCGEHTSHKTCLRSLLTGTFFLQNFCHRRLRAFLGAHRSASFCTDAILLSNTDISFSLPTFIPLRRSSKEKFRPDTTPSNLLFQHSEVSLQYFFVGGHGGGFFFLSCFFERNQVYHQRKQSSTWKEVSATRAGTEERQYSMSMLVLRLPGLKKNILLRDASGFFL